MAGTKNPFTFAVTGLAVAPPTVTTASAISITSTGALLNGTVNAQGSSGASTGFDYGPTATYNSVTSGNPTTVSGSSASSVNRSIANLSPGTTYHFRIKATNVAGTTTGSDFTFTTLTTQQSWLQNYFSTTSPTGDAALDADPNHNAVPNLAEYAFGGDPTARNGSTSFLPQSSVNPSTHFLQLSFTRYVDRNDIKIYIQAGDSPVGPWTDLASSTGGQAFVSLAVGAAVTETGTGNNRSVKVADIYTTSDPLHPTRFMRSRVTQ